LANFQLAVDQLTEFVTKDSLNKFERQGLIKDGHEWIDALEKRNILAHSYNEEYAKQAEELIKKNYFPMLRDACAHMMTLQ